MSTDLNQVSLLDPIHDSRWDDFVLNHPLGCVYQHSKWIRVIVQSYKQTKPMFFSILNGNGLIQASLPSIMINSYVTGTRIISLPFSYFSDPLVSNNKEFAALVEKVISIIEENKIKYFELRMLHGQNSIGYESLLAHKYQKTHILEIKNDIGKIWKSVSSDFTRAVKKSEKSGVIIKKCSTEEELKSFYEIHAKTRRRLGLPIQPYVFFQNMLNIMHPEMMDLCLAEHKGNVISGAIFFKYKNTYIYEHGASDDRYWELRPNHLMMWKAIQNAHQDGYEYYDFGKTSMDNAGLLEFKRKWGAVEYDVPYYYYPRITGLMSLEKKDTLSKWMSELGRKMPMPLAKIMGEIAYKHLG